MIDDIKDLSVNILLESAEEDQKKKKFFEEEIWEPKRETFFDIEYLSEVRSEIAVLVREEKGGEKREAPKAITWKKLTGLRRYFFWIWRIFFKWHEFTGLSEFDIIDQDVADVRKVKQVTRQAKQELPELKVAKKIHRPSEIEVHTEELSPIRQILLKSGFKNWYLKQRKKITASPYILSIDIEDGLMSYTVYNRSKIPRLEKFGIFILQKDVSGDEKTEADSIRQGIQKLVGNPFIELSDVFVTLGSLQSKLWISRVPKVSEKELKQLAEFQIKKELAEAEREYQTDYTILGTVNEENIEKTVIGFSSVKKSYVRIVLDTLSEFSLHPVKIMISENAVAGYLRQWEQVDFDSVVEVIDISMNTSSIYVIQYGTVTLTRSISIGMNNFIEAFIGSYPARNKTVAIDRKRAETLSEQYGIPAVSNPNFTEEHISLGELGRAVQPAVEKFLTETSRTLQHFRGQLSGEKIDDMFVIGPGSTLLRLPDIIKEETGHEFRTVSFPENLNLSAEVSDESGLLNSYSWLVHSLGAAGSEYEEFNLITEEGLNRKKETQIWALISAAGIVTGLLLGSISWNILSGRFNALDELEKTREAMNTFLGSSKEYRELSERKETLAKMQVEIGSSLISIEENNVTSGLLKMLSNVIPPGVTLERAEYASAGDNLSHGGVITISGKLDPGFNESGEKLLVDFLVDIQKTPLFTHIEMVGKNEREDVRNEGDFELKIQLAPNFKQMLIKREGQ